MKRYKFSLIPLIVLLLTIVFTADTRAAPDPLEKALANEQFQQLYHFLERQGYSVVREEITVTTVDEYASADVDVEVTLVPLMTPAGAHARVAYWEGHWNSRNYSGGLATIAKSNMLLFADGVVRPVESSADLEEYIGFPLYAVGGSVPYGMPVEEVTVSSDAVNALPNSTAPSRTQPLATNGCKTVYVARNGYSIFGSLIWTFNMSKYFCYDGSSVFNINVSAWASNMDWAWTYRGIVSSSDYSIAGGHLSMRQGHMEACYIGVPCGVANAYPGIEIKVYNNGSFQNRSWE